MAQVQGGDRAAFETLVHRHVDGLYGYARRLVSNATQAEDLTQEAWLIAWHKAGTYNARKAGVRTWLYRILHNLAVDQRRREHPTQPLENIEIAVTEDEPTIGLQRLSDAIGELGEQQRSAMALTYLRGFSNRECAHIMGIGLRAFESLLVRGRRALQNALENDVNETQHEVNNEHLGR